jgi:hypothetical protein
MDRFPVGDDDDDFEATPPEGDREIGVVYNPDGTRWSPGPPKKGSLWLVLGSVTELLADLFGSFRKFFDTLTEESMAKYRYTRSAQTFHQQAAREIETLISGAYDATTTESGRGVGTGSAE